MLIYFLEQVKQKILEFMRHKQLDALFVNTKSTQLFTQKKIPVQEALHILCKKHAVLMLLNTAFLFDQDMFFDNYSPSTK